MRREKVRSQAFLTQPDLDGFNVEDWQTWMLRVLSGGDPRLETAEHDPDKLLLLASRNLVNPAAFNQALRGILEHLRGTNTNAGRLYYLLQAISILNPPECKRLLRRRLNEEEFAEIFFGNISLAHLALSVLCCYDIDDETLDLLLRQSQKPERPEHLVLCIRLLAKRDMNLALSLMERHRHILIREPTNRQLARVLQGAIWRNGGKPLFSWLKRLRLELGDRETQVIVGLEDLIRRWVVPWDLVRLSDPYATLLSAHLWAGEKPFAARDLVHLARLVGEPMLYDDPDLPEETLRRIWNTSEERIEEWGQEEEYYGLRPPWWIYGDDTGGPTVETYWRPELLREPAYPQKEYLSWADEHLATILFQTSKPIPEKDNVIRFQRSRRLAQRPAETA